MVIDSIIQQLSAPAGVYVIENDTHDKFYIGSSNNIKSRLYFHERKLQSGSHENTHLQHDYDNGVKFYASAMRLMVYPTHNQLMQAECKAINDAKREGKQLYNIAKLSKWDHPIQTKEAIIHMMADLYCKEHFGATANTYLNRNNAEIEMIYECMMDPSNEEKIRDRFKNSIETTGKIRHYASYGIDYEKCVISAELNGTTVKEEIEREKKLKAKQ